VVPVYCWRSDQKVVRATQHVSSCADAEGEAFAVNLVQSSRFEHADERVLRNCSSVAPVAECDNFCEADLCN
jgi:hypothetical protein